MNATIAAVAIATDRFLALYDAAPQGASPARAESVRRDLAAMRETPSRAALGDLARSLYSWCERVGGVPVSPGVAAMAAPEVRAFNAELLAAGTNARNMARLALLAGCSDRYVSRSGVMTPVEDLSAADLRYAHGARIHRSALGAPIGDGECVTADGDFVQTVYRLGDDGKSVHQDAWD